MTRNETLTRKKTNKTLKMMKALNKTETTTTKQKKGLTPTKERSHQVSITSVMKKVK
jgi:hypothetical protein